MKRYSVLALALVAGGCAGISEMQATYGKQPKGHFSHASLPIGFDVYDKPSEGRVLLIIDKSAAIQKGAIKGATLYIADISTPLGTIKQAATLYLASKGRSCTVNSAKVILQPTHYEAFYTCSGGQ